MAPLYSDRAYTSPLRPRLAPHIRDGDRLDPFSLDAGIDRVGDYVTRRLVPAMLSRSERPVQLVMNFGTLHLLDDGGYPRRGSVEAGSNAVVYNPPEGVVTMGGGTTGAVGGSGTAGVGARRPSLLGPGGIDGEGGYGYGIGSGSGAAYGRRVAICDGCFKRQLVGATGYCLDCVLTRERLRTGLDALDGVRYGYGRTPERESERLRRQDIEREVLREMDEERLRELEEERLKGIRERRMRSERQRRMSRLGIGGYYSDVERDEVRHGADHDGFSYRGERW